MTTFGIRFKELRNEKKLTQDELVENFNKKYNTRFNKSTISQYENNKRKPEVNILENWADFFDVSIDYLLGRNDERNHTKEIKNAITIAAHRLGDVEQLPDDAIDEINNYIDLMRLKYLKDKK
ncbi:helix-turn-helix domain-containing protein [Terrisporobacter glycolicus]|uniref:helix-turn-helix domain-containing protein n=1 Tax=Terrisporobacter glycolicus TaxID=36841 RepID=UPI000360D042|nr:helix-turn-helix transcriptional regulator [Terrisporobacter glycolicus]